MPKVLAVLLKAALCLYPFYVWYAISYWHPAAALLPVAMLLLLKSCLPGTERTTRAFFAITALFLLLALWLEQAEQAMLFYPVWVNAGLLLLFSASLIFPPPVIERLARLMEGELDARGIAYTRKVTQVWCVFFLLNGGIAAITAVIGNWNIWLWYNGVISYGLMGLLMLIEWQVRRVVKAAS
ncbi:hypothetical protein QE250_11785 [Chromatiaceae bacterium AAb-1]|jgi:uncharacterized membrane protein|nr:hypothetical protein [Chromatiaceae bacterium AAb-1]